MVQREKELGKVLQKFSVKALEDFCKKFHPLLYSQFSKSSKIVKKATLCKMIVNRTDMISTPVYKKACKWLKDHQMSKEIGI